MRALVVYVDRIKQNKEIMKENRRFREERIREIREREFFEAMERDRDHYDDMRVRADINDESSLDNRVS